MSGGISPRGRTCRVLPRVMHNNSAQLKTMKVRPPRPGPVGAELARSGSVPPPASGPGPGWLLVLPGRHYIHPRDMSFSLVVRRRGLGKPVQALATRNSRNLRTPFEQITREFVLKAGPPRRVRFSSPAMSDWPLELVITERGLLVLRWDPGGSRPHEGVDGTEGAVRRTWRLGRRRRSAP